MRNRALHDALREFALEAASLLTDELRNGAEIEFDVLDEGGGRGPALYRYRPRTAEFVAARWEELRALPACARAGAALGVGASLWLRVNGMDGERAEPALRTMLERLYEDATSFGFPEERFERLYEEVERTLYAGVQRGAVAVALRGVALDCDSIDFGRGVSLARAGLPPEAAWAEAGPAPEAVVLVERDTSPGEQVPAAEVEEAAGRIVTAMRLLRPGAASVSAVAWRRTQDGRFSALALTGDGGGRGDDWVVADDDVEELRDLVRILIDDPLRGAPAWALRRFELGCAQASSADALSDYLLALRALLDATGEAGIASLAPRVAALCAEAGARPAVQRRIELALALERFAMQGGGHLDAELRAESAPQLVAEVEGHLRALLRDIVCGYLEPDLKSVADDILLDAREAVVAPAAASEREWFEEPDTAEVPALAIVPPAPGEAVAPVSVPPLDDAPILASRGDRFERAGEPEPALDVEPEAQQPLDGVTPSADWGFGDPEDFSAPI
jgi:hypothetical protein